MDYESLYEELFLKMQTIQWLNEEEDRGSTIWCKIIVDQLSEIHEILHELRIPG